MFWGVDNSWFSFDSGLQCDWVNWRRVMLWCTWISHSLFIHRPSSLWSAGSESAVNNSNYCIIAASIVLNALWSPQTPLIPHSPHWSSCWWMSRKVKMMMVSMNVNNDVSKLGCFVKKHKKKLKPSWVCESRGRKTLLACQQCCPKVSGFWGH